MQEAYFLWQNFEGLEIELNGSVHGALGLEVIGFRVFLCRFFTGSALASTCVVLCMRVTVDFHSRGQIKSSTTSNDLTFRRVRNV